jgi:hypothetical protein
MRAKAPSDYELFVLEQQEEILTNPITALANDIPGIMKEKA